MEGDSHTSAEKTKKNQEKTKDITVNKQGFSEEEREKLESLSHKKKGSEQKIVGSIRS